MSEGVQSMATIECYYDQCPGHEANHLPSAKLYGPFCNHDECTATTEALDEYARRRTRILARLQFLVPREDTGGGQGWP